MKKWILKDDWLFEILAHKASGRIKVRGPRVDRRDRALARRLARIISASLNARLA